jgi:hypothetical protein
MEAEPGLSRHDLDPNKQAGGMSPYFLVIQVWLVNAPPNGRAIARCGSVLSGPGRWAPQ